jgi:hypothetical protein
MNGILRGKLGIHNAITEVGFLSTSADPKHVSARMHGSQSRKCLLQPVRKRVMSRIHTGKECVPAGRRHFTGVQHRTQRGFSVIAMVGVPAAADVCLLIWLLPHLSYLGITGNRLEESVDIDRAEGARKS